eukprot:SAG22_NODE_632_length_8376_cov_4.201160_2_plen_508_part_00
MLESVKADEAAEKLVRMEKMGTVEDKDKFKKYEEMLDEKDHELTVIRKALWMESTTNPNKKKRKHAKKIMTQLNGERALHQSPNTVRTIKALEEVGAKTVARKPAGHPQPIMTWAFVFQRPKILGPVEEEGDPPNPQDLDTAVSHECWMFCERAIASDLIIESILPIDGKTIIITVAADYDVLVDEADTTNILMRLQETKGAIPFRKDLIRYYNSNHGGLTEYRDGIWEKRDPNNAEDGHWKNLNEMSEDEIAELESENLKIFPSGLAQRLVMSRLRRRAHYDPDWMMSISDASKAARHVKRNIKTQKNVPATILHEALICVGGYRPGGNNTFPVVDGREVVTDVSKMCVADPNIILKPNDEEGMQRFIDRGHDPEKQVTYSMLPDFVRICEEWQEGRGREEQFVQTLRQYYPLHFSEELAYLKEQWGSPKLIFQCRITGYNPEGEPKVLTPGNPYEQRPAEIELNTFGSSGNSRMDHGFPANLTFQVRTILSCADPPSPFLLSTAA